MRTLSAAVSMLRVKRPSDGGRSMTTPLVEFACGSASTSNVFRSAVASDAARLTAVVVLPTPPFWLAIAITRGILQVIVYQWLILLVCYEGQIYVLVHRR